LKRARHALANAIADKLLTDLEKQLAPARATLEQLFALVTLGGELSAFAQRGFSILVGGADGYRVQTGALVKRPSCTEADALALLERVAKEHE
jgi:hypothetical protein